MIFSDNRFPEDISYGSTGGPEFSTDIVTNVNGYEQRQINWLYARAKYNIGYAIKSHDQLTTLINFFYAHKGRAIPFRFKDWSDYQVENQLIAVGDGKNKNFQLIKNYSVKNNSYTRKITKPVPGSVKIYFEKILQKDGFHVDFNTGQLKFDQAPKENTKIYSSFEFDVPVRFDSDFLPTTIEGYGNYNANNVLLIEVKM